MGHECAVTVLYCTFYSGYHALSHAVGHPGVSMSVQNMVSQPLVKAVVIINTKGGRVCSRFCDKAMWPDLEAERSFEGTLLKKVQALGEISHGTWCFPGSPMLTSSAWVLGGTTRCLAIAAPMFFLVVE